MSSRYDGTSVINLGDAKTNIGFGLVSLDGTTAVEPDPRFITFSMRHAALNPDYTRKTLAEIELEKISIEKHPQWFSPGNFI